MTLGQGNDTPLSYRQHVCGILFRSDKGVRSYGPDKIGTDRQTDGVILTYPKCLRGIIITVMKAVLFKILDF